MFTDAYFPRINGVSISVKSYADELASMGHKILIICCDYTSEEDINPVIPTKSFMEETDNPNINVYRVSSLPVIISKEDKLARLSQWNKIKKQLNPFKPDIIHINSEFSLGLLGLVYGHYKLIPIVFTFHTLWEEYAANYMKYIPDSLARRLGREIVIHYLKRADEIIVPTQRIADVVAKYGIDKKPDILPTGIPKSVYITEPEKMKNFTKVMEETYPVIKNKKILLYVGRIAKEKNLEFLIESFERIQETNPETVLVFVGGGPDLENIKQIASENKYGEKIIFTGYCDREDLPYFYHSAEVFVFPSVTETQGLVTIEAMMCGTPVVAIGEMGTYDVMQGDNGGFMVENSIDIFTEKVQLLLNNKDLHKEKSADALKWSKNWSISSLTPKLISYYKKGIENIKNRYI